MEGPGRASFVTTCIIEYKMRKVGIVERQQKGLARIDNQNKVYKEASEFECFKFGFGQNLD